MCEKTEFELDGLTFLRFKGTGYLLCCLCYEKLGSPEYFNINNNTNSSCLKQKQKIPHNIRIKVYERDAYRCVYCGSFKDLTIDHEHPESKGGETYVDNLVTCCRVCNCKKGVKSRGDFVGKSTT
jgi:5-methylcytosine-specific restriction endonuclease McrA